MKVYYQLFIMNCLIAFFKTAKAIFVKFSSILLISLE